MSETTMLIMASISMFGASAIAAVALFLLNLSPIWIVLGGTLAGISVYVAFCTFGSKFVRQELVAEESENG